MRKLTPFACAIVLTASWSVSAVAASSTVDCTKKGKIQSAINKFDKSSANTVTIVGACVENVVVSTHRDLTIIGEAGASLAAAVADSNAAIEALGSRVTVRNLPVSGNQLAQSAVSCNDRSVCILENVTVSGATLWGIFVQKQSSADVIGSPTTVISGSGSAGIGVYGQSSVNISPSSGIDQPGITITGNGVGIDALDGSFVRVENAQISSNTIGGVSGNRGAVVKVFGTTISGNGGPGILMRASTVQTSPQFDLPLNIVNNVGPGVVLRHLSSGQIAGSAPGVGTTSISGNGGLYPTGVDCLSTGALRTDSAIRAASNPACLVE